MDQRHLCADDQRFGLFYPDALDISGRRDTMLVLEHTTEVKAAQTCGGRKLLKSDGAIWVVFDVSHRTTDGGHIDRDRRSLFDAYGIRVTSYQVRGQRHSKRFDEQVLRGMRRTIQLRSKHRTNVLDHGIAHPGDFGEFKTPRACPSQLSGHLVHFAKVQPDVEVCRHYALITRLSTRWQNSKLADTGRADKHFPAGFPPDQWMFRHITLFWHGLAAVIVSLQ
jgi:hypothetical protein